MQVTGLNGTSDMAVMRVANSSNSSSKRYINIAVSGNSGYGYGALAGQTIRTISVEIQFVYLFMDRKVACLMKMFN